MDSSGNYSPGLQRRSASSVTFPRKSSQISLLNDNHGEHNRVLDDRNWSWNFLRKNFKTNNLQGLYQRYQRRLQNAYFNVFLLLQVVLSLAYIVILLSVSLTHIGENVEIEGCKDSNDENANCIVKDNLELAVPEMICHAILLIYCLITYVAVYDETLFRSTPTLQLVFSVVTCLVILLGDISLTIHYFSTYRLIRTPAAFPNIVIIYFFLPLQKKREAVVLGIIVTLSHVIVKTIYMVEAGRDNILELTVADIIYYLGGNVVGVYSRLLTEVAIRRAFLDRRGFVYSTIKKKYEENQENQLLESILPKHISEYVKEELRNAIAQLGDSQSQSSHRNSSGSAQHHHGLQHKKPFSDLFVERHNNVSILFADIVNFTPLTVTMTADDLVATLNELFGKFDNAATKNNCVRIKLLGDCYYCVSGLKENSPDHAKNCVELGFEMIHIIKEIRDKLQVNLRMRIGVHSGNILSGLLGIYKWQFDIWSGDVTIAQHMEQSGKPGFIHITERTKSYLGDTYICKRAYGYGRYRDKYLEDNKIDTYFITPPRRKSSSSNQASEAGADEDDFNSDVEDFDNRKSKYGKSASSNPLQARRGSQNVILARKQDNAGKRKSIRINHPPSMSDVQRLLDLMKQVHLEMGEAIDNMPLRKTEQWCPGSDVHKNSITNQVNPYTMSFRKLESELYFQKQPDPLFKYYIACSLFILLCIGIIQGIVVPAQHILLWVSFGMAISYLLILIPFVWVGYIWSRIRDPHREMEYLAEPESRIVKYFFNFSNKVSRSWSLRTVLYLSISLLISAFAIIDVFECTPDVACQSPWYFTYSCSLAILIIYAFFRVHYFMKLIVNIIAMTGYFTTIFLFRYDVFSQNNGVSPSLSAAHLEVFSHIVYLVWIITLLHTMDRQMEYINRLDFIWKKKLTEGHKEASMTHAVNTVLIHNILPMQIAKIYLDPNRIGEGYSRTYHNVSIMFASIPNFMDFYTENELNQQGITCLNVLNQIITEFDQALFNFVDVEKIKVIGSTYMAACGLEVHETGRLSTVSLLGVEEISEYRFRMFARSHLPSWRDYGSRSFNKTNPEKQRKTLVTLVRYAAAMMQRLARINREAFQDFKLRVGIATGQVVAGVVGTQKPLFDTWSDTVNLASRLDTHGEVGKIHIMERGAELLSQLGIKCECRGEIRIKGKEGYHRTYYVCMDNDFKIQELRPISRDHNEEAISDCETIDTHL